MIPWFGFARCPFDFVLSFLSWPNGCVEPVSCDPAWFRSGELDDGSGLHYAFLDYASGLALDRLGDPVLPLRLGGDSPVAIRGGPGRGSRPVDADAFDIVSRCSTPGRFCRGVSRGGWFCGLFRSLQPPRRFGRNSGFRTSFGDHVYQVAFPGGSGRFDFPGAAAMSLLVAPITAFLLFLLLQARKVFFSR